MTKAYVDELIKNMRSAGMVSKAAPWMFEGMVEKKMNVRYVGLQLKDDWLDIMSDANNLLLKFIYDRNTAYIESYLANKPPFIKLLTLYFKDGDKWEPLLGELKRRLKKDKADVLSHKELVGNLYSKIQPQLK